MRYVLLVICCYSQWVLGQDGPRLVNWYRSQNGLSNNCINCVCQDSRGFLWLGTQEGLNRFDGFQFKKFFVSGNSSLPANNTILDIVEYRTGQLLLATSNGL